MKEFISSTPNYSGYLAIELIDDANQGSAGAYAGWISAAFMLGRATMSYPWGRAADRFGRKSTLLLSLAASCLWSIAFGMSTTFAFAFLARFCLGVSNGILATIKTTTSEIAKNNEKLESSMMSTIIGLSGWAYLFAPAIAGALSEPLKLYPQSSFIHDPWIQDALGRWPFLLPNLLGSLLCLMSMGLTLLFIPETLPPELHQSPMETLETFSGCCRRTLSRHQYERITETNRSAEKEAPGSTMAAILSDRSALACLLICSAFSFSSFSLNEAFPLFLLSNEGGFGLTELQIGKILSLCGLAYAISQYYISTAIYNRFGLIGSIRLGSLLSAPAFFLLPLSILINAGTGDGELKLSTTIFLAATMAMNQLFSLIFFSHISIALNRMADASQRATINGIATLGGAAAKALGPISAGLLISFSTATFGRAASLFTFGILGCIALAIAAVTWTHIKETPVEDSEERSIELAPGSDKE